MSLYSVVDCRFEIFGALFKFWHISTFHHRISLVVQYCKIFLRRHRIIEHYKNQTKLISFPTSKIENITLFFCINSFRHTFHIEHRHKNPVQEKKKIFFYIFQNCFLPIFPKNILKAAVEFSTRKCSSLTLPNNLELFLSECNFVECETELSIFLILQ